MMDRDPWGIWQFLNDLPEPFKAAILSFVIAMLRILYDDKNSRWTRKFLEALLCGGITLSVVYLAKAIGMTEGWGIFVGGAIGLFGADQVREWGRHMAEKRIR